MHHQCVLPRNLTEQVQIPQNQLRLCHNPDPVPRPPPKHLQQTPRHPRPPLDRLVRVRRRPNRNLLRRIHFAELLLQQPRRILLQINQPFKQLLSARRAQLRTPRRAQLLTARRSLTVTQTLAPARTLLLRLLRRLRQQELVRIPGVAVLAPKLASPIRINAVRQRKTPLRYRPV